MLEEGAVGVVGLADTAYRVVAHHTGDPLPKWCFLDSLAVQPVEVGSDTRLSIPCSDHSLH